MKIRFSKLMTLVAVLFGGMLASCAPEEITRVPSKLSLENADEMGATALTFSNRAETKDFSFTADGDWYIRIPKECDWLTATPASGTGNATVKLTTKLYEEAVPRSVKLSFVVDGVEQKALIDVTQLQKFHLDVTVENPILGKTGGDVTFPVVTNGTYDVQIAIKDGSDANWLTCVSSTSQSLTLNAAAILGKRNDATVTLTCVEDPNTVAQFVLTQKNLQLSFDYAEAHVKGEVTTVDLPVTVLNIDTWNVTTDANWCTATTANGKVVVSMDALTAYTVRTATFNISTPEDPEIRGSISLTQYPAGVITPDLCNVVYDQNGNARDLSPKASNVERYNGNGSVISTAYYEDYGRYAPYFTCTMGSKVSTNDDKFGYYIDYTDWQAPFNDGYTLEAVFSIAANPNGTETKAFGGTGSGGFAIMVGSSGRGAKIEFIQNDSGTWRFGTTNIAPVPGQYYHVIGVWDAVAKKLYTYVDGVKCAEITCNTIRHMNTTAKKLGIGANHVNTGHNGAWFGDVIVSRAYDAIMTPEQVKAATAAVNIPAELYSREVYLK